MKMARKFYGMTEDELSEKVAERFLKMVDENAEFRNLLRELLRETDEERETRKKSSC